MSLRTTRAPMTKARNQVTDAVIAPNAKLNWFASGKAAPNVPITSTVSSHATGLRNETANNAARVLPLLSTWSWQPSSAKFGVPLKARPADRSPCPTKRRTPSHKAEVCSSGARFSAAEAPAIPSQMRNASLTVPTAISSTADRRKSACRRISMSFGPGQTNIPSPRASPCANAEISNMKHADNLRS